MTVHPRSMLPMVAAGAVATLALASTSPAIAVEGLRFTTKASAAQEVPLADDAEESLAYAEGDFLFNLKLQKVNADVRIPPSNEVASAVVQAHLHCAIAGQNGDVILDLLPEGIVDDVLSGVIVRGDFSNADLGEGDCVEACGFEVVNIASLRAAAGADCLYLNVHTEDQPSGEVRGQLLPDPVRVVIDTPE